ncbi:hypothetical protein ACOSP7_014005 [Xanthoceras sorbifolium]
MVVTVVILSSWKFDENLLRRSTRTRGRRGEVQWLGEGVEENAKKLTEGVATWPSREGMKKTLGQDSRDLSRDLAKSRGHAEESRLRLTRLDKSRVSLDTQKCCFSELNS